MNAIHPAAHPGDPEITPLSPTRWQAVADGRVLGHADAAQRTDGRTFVSIASWDDTVFDRLAVAMLNDLPTPLHTVVGERETDLRSRWEHAGFTFVDESAAAAIALFDGLGGARRAGSNLELVLR